MYVSTSETTWKASGYFDTNPSTMMTHQIPDQRSMKGVDGVQRDFHALYLFIPPGLNLASK